jgi:energy-converting hydrogenase Eha subunit G
VILLFRQKLFSLPRRELFIITAVHFLRIVAYVGLTALMWHLVLPGVGYGLWLVLATLRMLISRLPLVPQGCHLFGPCHFPDGA